MGKCYLTALMLWCLFSERVSAAASLERHKNQKEKASCSPPSHLLRSDGSVQVATSLGHYPISFSNTAVGREEKGLKHSA